MGIDPIIKALRGKLTEVDRKEELLLVLSTK